jgi:hypothetical protein
MSAGVGRHEGANPADFYPTPPRAAVALRDFWIANFGAPEIVIDPCAGMGCLLKPWQATTPVLGWERDQELLEEGGDESRELGISEGDGLQVINELELTIGSAPVLVMVNPPFSAADEWVRTVVQSCERQDAAAAILLRSQWIDDGNTKGRGAYRYEREPTAILRLPWRIRFNGKGADSCTYAWHIWHPDSADFPSPLRAIAELERSDSQKVTSSRMVPTFWARLNPTLSPAYELLGAFWERAAAVSRGD